MKIHLSFFDWLMIIFICLIFCSCKTTAPIVTPSVNKDSVRVSVVRDSVRVYERDSVFVMYKPATGDRQQATGCCDTLYLEKWHTRYRDREVAVHDTIYQVQKETEVVTEKYTPPFYKRCTWGFWVLLVLLIGSIAFRILKAIYLRR